MLLVASIPLLVVVAIVIASVLGYRMTSVADAASSAEPINLGATVGKIVTLDTSGCSGAALAIGDITPDIDPMKFTTVDCTVSFASNNSALGAQLTVAENPAALPAGHAMKCQAVSCAGSFLDDYSAAGAAPAGTSAFGVRLDSATGAASNVWPVAPAIRPAADAATVACQTASAANGTCAFRFGATAKSSEDGTGAYSASVLFAAQAL